MEEVLSEVEITIHGGSIIRSGGYYSRRKYNQEWRLLFKEEV